MQKEQLKRYLQTCKKAQDKKITLFFDIETLRYNIEQAEKENKPTKNKNMMYAFAVSYFFNNKEHWCNFPNTYYFLEFLFDSLSTNGVPSYNGNIELIAHNNNKYDNHFLIYDLKYHYDIAIENMYLKNAVVNQNTRKISDYKTKSSRSGVILEKRVKSKNNVDFIMFLNGLSFRMVDNVLKTNASIDTLGKKLHDKSLIPEEYLKTDYVYDKYDIQADMSDSQAKAYCLYVFNNLTEQENIYIRNDVYILAFSVRYYTTIYPNFDYSMLTLTSNISKMFNDNDITSVQMLNRTISEPKLSIRYTDYFIGDENFYDYLKSFYKGGMNLYNPRYLNQILNVEAFGIDINSSYPYSMDNHLIPTFLDYYKVYDVPTDIKIVFNDKRYYLYRMTQEDFNNSILENIESNIIKQMLVKYYTNSLNDYVNINTYTMKIINMFSKVKINNIKVLSVVIYECIEFGSREFLFKNYYTKTQGSLKNKIVMNSPYDYEILDEINEHPFSDEEIYISKVYNNGAYGIPALRPYFNLFRLMENKEDYENLQNGFKNTERNIIFSIFVTSVSLYNLLTPLSFLSPSEIDECFLYCDTDSLYLLKKIEHKLPHHLFDDISLGAWSYDVKDISKFFILNHKKYAYFSNDINSKTGLPKGIVFKSGGIELASFSLFQNSKGELKKSPINLTTKEKHSPISFERFINEQFHHSVAVKSKKSIMNEQGVITIYESDVLMEMGKDYPILFSEIIMNRKRNMLTAIKEDFIQNDIEYDDVLFIESEVGVFSISELFYEKETIKNKKPLFMLRSYYAHVKEHILQEE